MSLGLGLGLGIGRQGGGAAPRSASLLITWTDNSGQEAGHRIEKRIVGETEWVTALVVGANVESATITGLPFNTQVEIRVIPFNDIGNLEPVETLQVYTAPPSAPSALTAVAGSSGTINLAWENPAIEPITGYRIYIKRVGDWEVAGTVVSGVSEYSASGLLDSTEYQFYVVGYNANTGQRDSETAPSNVVSETTAVESVAPTVSSATINAVGTLLTLVFSEPVKIGAGGSGGLTLSATGGAVTATYSGGSGTNTLTWPLSRAITSTETVTRSYTQPGNGIEDLVGNDLASFSGQAVTNGSEAVGYLGSLDFEEAGKPSSVTVTNGTFNWDATDWPGGVPNGSQSLKLTATNQLGYINLPAAYGELWVYCMFHVLAGSGANQLVPIRIQDEFGGNLAHARFVESDGSIRAFIGTNSTSTGPGTFFASGTTYHMWLRHVKATAALNDGRCEVYISTDGIRRARDAWGPGYASISRIVGTLAVDAKRVAFDMNAAGTIWIDKLRISNSAIGNNPS